MDTKKAVLRVGSIFLKVVIYVVIFLGIFNLGKTTYHYTHAVFYEEAMEAEPGRTMRVKIPEDMSSEELAKALEKQGLVKDARIFRIQMKVKDFPEKVKAGSYELNTSMTPSQMLEILSGANEDDS